MIVGFSITSISAERKSVPRGRIDINSSPKISSVKKSKMGFLKKETPLSIGFEFVTRYEPKVGQIRIKGHVLYLGENMKKTLKTWEKEKKFPKAVDTEVKNFLFRKCLTIGVNLSESMQLMKIKSVMCVPLISRSTVRGVIYVDSVSKPHGFRKEDLSLLTALSIPAAYAIENALLHPKADRKA